MRNRIKFKGNVFRIITKMCSTSILIMSLDRMSINLLNKNLYLKVKQVVSKNYKNY